MRKGILGSLAALAAGAGMAWGQSASTLPSTSAKSGKAFVGGGEVVPVNGTVFPQPGPIIPPALPVPGGEGGVVPYAGPVYPPPANFQDLDPNSLPQIHGSLQGPLSEAPLFWMNTDYLLYFVKSQPSRYPLVTTSNINSAGRLNNPTTTSLFAESAISYNITNGFRLTTGFFKDADRRSGFEFSGFLLQDKTKAFQAASDQAGSPVLARPFVNGDTGQQSSLVIASPNVGAGSITVATTTSNLGGEGNYVLNLFRSCPEASHAFSLNMLFGLRYLQLQENLSISSVTNILPGGVLPAAFGTFPAVFGGLGSPTLFISDNFRTLNSFYAGQLGLQSELRRGRWVFGGNYKLAFGDMHSRVDITGVTTATRGTFNPITGSIRGGLLANAQNEGRENNDRFALAPEINLNAGFQLTSHLLMTMGYNFLYMTNVVRPGEIVPAKVIPGLIPADPTFGATTGVLPRLNNFRESDFFLQGLNFGFTFRY